MSAPAQPASFLPGGATTKPHSIGALLSLSLRRRDGRRAVSAVVVMLFVASIGLFAAPAVTDLIAKWHQHELRSQFTNPALKTEYRTGNLPIGSDLTQLVADTSQVHINVLVVQGTTPSALEAGAGHYTHTPLPCYQGNVGIAGHRTTYGRPFNKINLMHAGDTVKLITPIGTCSYQVVSAFDNHSNPWVVAPNDFSVVSQQGVLGSGHWLTLTSCNPPGSAAQRIVLRLKMISSTVSEPSSALAGKG